MASQDLGGLGAKDGPAIAVHWTPPRQSPHLLAYLALLLFLLPKCNRSKKVWWIIAPLAFNMVLILSVARLVRSEGPDLAQIFPVFHAVTFGLAAVWLLLPDLSGRARLLTFVKMLFIMLTFSIFTYAAGQSWSSLPREIFLWGTLVGMGLVLSVAINLAAWSSRGQFSRYRLGLILWIFVGWIAVFVVMSVKEGAGALMEMTVIMMVASGITLILLVPFVMLAFYSEFFRDRLKAALRLE